MVHKELAPTGKINPDLIHRENSNVPLVMHSIEITVIE